MLFLTALGGAMASHAEDNADLILHHGVFYPVSRPGAVHGSMVVRAGRIVFLGSDVEAGRWRGPATRVIELDGRAVTPGLIDAHSHLEELGRVLAQVQLDGVPSYAAMVDKVKAAARQVPAGAWVRGHGWDQNLWGEKTLPDNRRLSEAIDDHPVWLERVDGHAVLLNDRALEALGIGPRTANPPGGKIVRDASGRATGILLDNAYDLYQARLPIPSPEELRRRLIEAGRDCAKVGLTTVTDMAPDEGLEEATYRAYQDLEADGELPIRVAVFLHLPSKDLARWLAEGPRIDPQARLTIRGIKLFADGALGSRGAALIEPYDDDPGNLGLLRISENHIVEVCRAARKHGFQLGVHAIGDRANLVALDAYERCFDGEPHPELRFRIEHAQVMRLDDIKRMARLGIIASMQPTHATSDMPWAGERIGDRRLEGAYAWRRVLNAGGRLALGSDFPVESPDPRLGLYAAVTRQDLHGNPPGGWYSDQRLTRAEALRGFTLDAAYSLFLDKEVGSLDVGKLADLVVFNRDPMTVPAREIATDPIDYTVVAGKVVYQREADR